MTTATPRLSVSLGYWQDRPAVEALATAATVEMLGYDELWLGEMATYHAFALAGAIGTRHPGLTLTVGPLSPAIHDPVALAMGVATVAETTGCITRLAIGASSPVVVGRWHGRTYERTAILLREAATALAPLLEGDKADVDGALVHTTGFHLRTAAPGRHLTVAAFGDASVRVAAELADRMVVNLCTPQLVARLADRLATATTAVDRGPVPVAVWVPAAVDPTDEARHQLARSLVPYLAAPGYGEMFTASGFGSLVASARAGAPPRELLAQVPDELPEAIGVIGSADHCAERIAAYHRAGAAEVVLVPATAGDDAGERTLKALAGRT